MTEFPPGRQRFGIIPQQLRAIEGFRRQNIVPSGDPRLDKRKLERVDPQDFTIATVPKMLQRDGDPWPKLAPEPQTLPRSLR